MPWYSGAGRLAGGMAQANQTADEIRRAREQDAIQQAALLAGLEDQGIMRAENVEPSPVTLPNFSTMAPTAPGVTIDTSKVTHRPLGKTGFVRDQSRSSEAQRIASERQRQVSLRQRSAAVRAADPSLRDAPDDVIQGIVSDDSAYRERLKMRAQAPVRGTPEYLKAVEDEQRVRSKFDKGPAGSWASGTKDGKQGFFNPTTGDFREGPPGFQVTSAGAANEQQQKQRVFRNMQSALDGLEAKLKSGGSAVIPSEDADELGTLYQNVLLQSKEMYNLGVLNGPDYLIMQRILRDPTSLVGRARAFGSGKKQAERVLAQLERVRHILGDFQQNATPPAKVEGAAPQPSTDPEFDALMARYRKP